MRLPRSGIAGVAARLDPRDSNVCLVCLSCRAHCCMIPFTSRKNILYSNHDRVILSSREYHLRGHKSGVNDTPVERSRN